MTNFSEVKGHMGKMLMIVADTYAHLLDFLLEVVQNSIDANAQRIDIKIDMKSRKTVITDDGDGVTTAIFEQALQQIGVTMKADDKLGRFGRGLISPLGKCRSFTFTSCPRASINQYRQWTFVTANIIKQADRVVVPVESRADLQFCRNPNKSSRGKIAINWRTRVAIEDIIEDTALTRMTIDELESEIAAKFGRVIRKKKIQVRISFIGAEGREKERQVRISDFHGNKLPECKISSKHCGETLFDLYLAPMTAKGRNGRVLFGERGNDFRLSWAQFSASLRSLELVSQEVITALGSGIFEGEILSQLAQVHPNRKSFLKNDALVDFLVTIEEWYDRVGRAHYEEVREQHRERRYQELGTKAMQVLEGLIQDDEDLRRIIQQEIKFGSIGQGHVALPGVGEQDLPSRSIHGRHHSGLAGTNDVPRTPPQTEIPGHVPLSVAGPEGRKRTIVKGSSFGLTFVFSEMPGSLRPYELDIEHGIIALNTRHRYWFDCEVVDTKLTRYMETVGCLVLGLLPFYKSSFFDHQQQAANNILKLLVFDIVKGDVLTGRRHSVKPKKGKTKAA